MKKRLSSFLHASKWSKKSFPCCNIPVTGTNFIQTACIAVLLALLPAANPGKLAAQSMSSLTMPEISGPSMPSMPTISAGSVSISDSSSTSTSGTTTSSVTKSTGSSSTLGTGLTASSLLGLSSTTGLSTLSSLLGSDSDSSLLSSLLSSSSDSNDLSLLSALSGTTLGGTNTTTTILLTQIIDKLDQLSKQLEAQAGISSSSADPDNAGTASTAANAASKASSLAASAGTPGLIRFRVGGYDIIGSFTDLYISTPEKNGSFLLTADRTYTADYRQRTETVYMLFTAEQPASETGNGTGFLTSYTVTISLMQDYQNKNSFLYRLSQAAPLHAEKTGNLVSLRLNSELTAEILIQLE